MVLMRAPLGRRGSFVPTAFNVLQCLGWTVFELIVIATAAAALSDELLGFEARWAWTLLFGALALGFALMGPIGVVRRFIRRIAVWVMPAALAYLTWWAFDGADLGALWSQDGEGGLTFWQGADIVVAVTVSWIPLAADYTRFARSPRDAFWGTGLGYFVPDAWLLALGAILLLSRDLSDPVALPGAVAAGGLVALVALVALTVGETDEAFANAYSGAVSLQNLFPEAPLRLLVVATTGVGTLGALTIELGSFQTFLFLLGSFFVPLFAVLLADWLVAGRAYDRETVFGAPAWRPGMIAAWLAGFALYQWLTPTGPGWWLDAVERLGPPQWSIPVTVPSFLVSFGLASLAAIAVRRRATVQRIARVALIGPLSRDVVAGAPPRPGGVVYYAARAFARLGTAVAVTASCAAEDRDELLRHLEKLGVAADWRPSTTTAAYRFHYEGDRRIMRQEAACEPWTPEEAVAAAGDADWVHVGALTRSDFPADTLGALAAGGRPLLVDAQGLVRTPALGPLHQDADVGDTLRHVTILKLDEDEARILAGSLHDGAIRALGRTGGRRHARLPRRARRRRRCRRAHRRNPDRGTGRPHGRR